MIAVPRAGYGTVGPWSPSCSRHGKPTEVTGDSESVRFHAASTRGADHGDHDGLPARHDPWHWRKRLPSRHGQRCRVTARGKMNSIRVEFEDGYRMITSRYAVRRIDPEKEAKT